MKKTVIVTGGAKGIGREIVNFLAQKGHNIVLNYNSSEELAMDVKEMADFKGQNVEIFKADVTKREEVKKLIKFAVEKFKKIDVLINNAGISEYRLFTDITDDEWQRMIDVNLTSMFYTIQETIPFMIHRKEGNIINISSVWGMVGASCEVHYSVAKAGVNGLTKALAKELGLSNIRVNAIAPGAINTDMNKNLSREELESLEEETPLGRIGNPIDIARCVNWLVEDEFTTGQIISPNGGWVIT